MKQIPKYSHELIEQLVLEVPAPELPKSLKGWAGLTEGELRRGAFMAGRRALVEELQAALEEDNDSSGASEPGQFEVGPGVPQRGSMAPIHMADRDAADDYNPLRSLEWDDGIG